MNKYTLILAVLSVVAVFVAFIFVNPSFYAINNVSFISGYGLGLLVLSFIVWYAIEKIALHFRK